jgi:hypothetical protein
MQAKHLTRRFVLLLPFAVAACGGYNEDDRAFEPLRYHDLPPIQVKVASIVIEQRFIPAGVPPDVSGQAPTPPVEALKAMGSDRLQAFGTAGKAIFAVLDASLMRDDEDVVTGSFAVSLTIVDDSGAQLGFAEAHVQSRHTGPIDEIRPVLYDMTKGMMHDMNIEFEYQIRHNLKGWLTDAAAPGTPVEQAPLDGSAVPPAVSDAPPAISAAPPVPAPVPQSAPAYRPTYLQPPRPPPLPPQ